MYSKCILYVDKLLVILHTAFHLVNPERATYHCPSWIKGLWLNQTCPVKHRKCHFLPAWENDPDPRRCKAHPDLLPALCVLVPGKIQFNECKTEFPTWAMVACASPTCYLALNITQREELGTNKTGIWIFPWERLVVNWLGHKLSVGSTLRNLPFLGSFSAIATSSLKVHLLVFLVFLLASWLGQLCVWSGLELPCCSFLIPFVLTRNLFCTEVSCFLNNNEKQREVMWDWKNFQLFKMTTKGGSVHVTKMPFRFVF